MKQYLEGEGFAVIDCEDGAEALARLLSEDRRVDLVITDIEMPNMDGFELSHRIKDHPSFRELPIIALTSLTSDEDRQRGYDAGIDDYQVKMDREQVLAAVGRLLRDPVHRKTSSPTAVQMNEARECLV